jgi:hypothetical protein
MVIIIAGGRKREQRMLILLPKGSLPRSKEEIFVGQTSTK